MIAFCHLLNDDSGSPRVLRQAIEALRDEEAAELFVGSQGQGVLSSSPVATRRFWYRRGRWRLLTLCTYVASQILLYRRLCRTRSIPADAIVYVNTLLPFAAALWGRRTGRRVVYHLHEVSVTPGVLRRFLTWVAARTADRLLYVSEDHRARLPIDGVPTTTIGNPIDPRLQRRADAHHYEPRRGGRFELLMLASPRDFKGVPELLALAARLCHRDDIAVSLVLNGERVEIDAYLRRRELPDNVTVHGRTSDPAPHYESASLVLNLSRVDAWVETFGLTLAEAMAFGVPVIAPPVGGPSELVRDGVDGLLVDSRDVSELERAVLQLAYDPDRCREMSAAARVRAQSFGFDRFARTLREQLAAVRSAGRRA